MSRLPSSREVVRILEENGFVFISQRGSHSKYRYEKQTVIIPADRKEIPMGTLHSIIRQSGLPRDFFLK